MIDEVLNQTIIEGTNKLTFENVTSITTNPLMLIAIISVWLAPLILYLIIGCFAKGRSSSGRETSKPMIAYGNFWYSFALWFFLQSALFLVMIIFPLWLKLPFFS